MFSVKKKYYRNAPTFYRTGRDLLQPFFSKSSSRRATYGNMYWVMEAIHDLFYADTSGTPASTPDTMREQITPALDLSQNMISMNVWCNNKDELLAQAATLTPAEQFMLNIWTVSFNYIFDEAGVPETQQRLTYTQTDERDRPLRTVSVRRIDTRSKPSHTSIDLNRDHKSGHQMTIFKDATDQHIKMYEPELTASGRHLFDLTNDPSVIDQMLFFDQPRFELYKYVEILGKMTPSNLMSPIGF